MWLITFWCGWVLLGEESNAYANSTDDSPKRIISMSPAITEILFELRQEHRLVGVTEFCEYPKAAKSFPNVGGILNPNIETVLTLKPDLIIHQHDSVTVEKHAKNLGIATLSLNLTTLDHILKSIKIIGKNLRVVSQAKSLSARLSKGIEYFKSRLKDRPRRRVFLIFDDSQKGMRDIYAIGKGTFLDELLTLAGGENILSPSMVLYPKVSKEYVIAQSPEVIIEINPRKEPPQKDRESSKREWQRFPTVSAVKNNEIHFIGADHLMIPGPRVLLTVKQLAMALHPDLFESTVGVSQ